VAKERLGSPRARLFIALELPEEIVHAVAGWRQEALGAVDELRLVRPESLHVTLVFLGYQAERDIERIAEVSLGEGGGQFELTPQEVVPVPRSRPRLFALGLDDRGGALVGWQDRLSQRLEAADLYEAEKRPFWPHVTLARVKRGAKVPRGLELPELPPELRQPFAAFRVTLFRSTLKPSGAVYEALAGIPDAFSGL
jgi:RNA 2',3'-cyclic 3'-phosphodiesterase